MDKVFTREEWLNERKKHIGASDVASILGEDPRRGPLAIYEAKVTGHSSEDNAWLKYGRDIEGAIANFYEHETGIEVRDLGATSFQIHKSYPWLAATLDRVTERGPLELKSVDPYGAKITPNQWREDPPLHYRIQLQIQMACLCEDSGTLAALFPGYQLAYFDTDIDNELLDLAYPALEKFWDRVQRKDPPPPDSLPGTLDVVKRLYPRESGSTIVLEPEQMEIVNRWELLKATARDATRDAKALESQLRAVMQENTFGLMNDNTMLTLKETTRKAYVREIKESKFRTLRRSKTKGF